MIALQVLSKVIASKDISFLEDNLLTVDYFVGYEDEYNFITEHYKQYGNVPDKATFLSKFPQIELVEVTESDRYLVDTIREEYLYYKSVPDLHTLLAAVILGMLVCVIGYLTFQKLQRGFAEEL